MGHLYQSSHTHNEFWDGQHRFEHWYRDNSVYFITARCLDRTPAFRSERAKAVFWNRFEHWTASLAFVPWITTLMDNHYHTLGYLREGRNLGTLMQRLHGSVAKLVNDTLDVRLAFFWCDSAGHDYFDGCLRDPLQCRRAYRYTLLQCRRAGICHDPHNFPHTRVRLDVERGIERAVEIDAFLAEVPYYRYDRAAGR